MKNYGLILDKPIEGKDYILGGFTKVPFEVLQSSGDWTDYLPIRELQNYGKIEPYACVSFTILNCIEILIKRKYGIETNWSDRFLAFVSGTAEQNGNSPQQVCEFLRKLGVPPEKLWQFDETIDTREKFYSPIPPKLYEIAREFLDNYDFKYEFVPNDTVSMERALTSSPLLIAVPAWFENDGKYYRPDGTTDNHATTCFFSRKNEFWRVFDTYEPIIKDVEYNIAPAQIMRLWIGRKIKETVKTSWWQTIIGFIIKLWSKL